MHTNHFVAASLELHLFFCRIMKEHSLFLEAGFTPANADFAKKADFFKSRFEDLLCRAVRLSDGVVHENVLESGEILTDFTLESERNTEKLSGIDINTEITCLEMRLHADRDRPADERLRCDVGMLNKEILHFLDELIFFKETVLNNVRACRMFTMNYPLLIEHILREAKMYREQLLALERGEDFEHCVRETELFWDQIMMEHSLFMRGLLDPSENKLVFQANHFAHDYEKLIEETRRASDHAFRAITEKTLEETTALRDFKQAGAKGINDCQIKSVIVPLLADHVLREANHFIRILKEFER
ncbi:MAG: DUF2935 domain-containing protein [Clostridiales bacterium]|nr:DUF2935 domain-containing protein [Clostridiales bacterium]